MSSDPFEARLQLIQLLRRLTASQQSIQTVVSHAVKYGRKCGPDLWDCVLEECGKGNLNSRINILYFCDSLCDPKTAIGAAPSVGTSAAARLPYNDLLNRDLIKLIDLVVPQGKAGILNVLSAKQILEAWRHKQMISSETADRLIEALEQRRQDPEHPIAEASSLDSSRKRPHAATLSSNLSRADIFRRMEEDRERHKRLREAMWVLPIPGLTAQVPAANTNGSGLLSGPSPAQSSPRDSLTVTPMTPASPSTAGAAMSSSSMAAQPLVEELNPLDVEFDMQWETVSDFGEDDERALRHEFDKAPPLPPAASRSYQPEK